MCVMEKAATSRRASSSSSTLKRAFSMMRRLSDPSTSTRVHACSYIYREGGMHAAYNYIEGGMHAAYNYIGREGGMHAA